MRGRLLDELIKKRLVVTDRDDRMQPVAGIAHEALLTHWPRLKELLAKDREFLRARTRAAIAARRWDWEKRHNDFLLHEGKPLAEARELLKTRRDDLDPETVEFIDHSIRYRTHQRRRSRRAIAAIVGIVFTVMSAFAAFSFVEWCSADDALQLALRNAGDVSELAERDLPLAGTQEETVRRLLEEGSARLRAGGTESRASAARSGGARQKYGIHSATFIWPWAIQRTRSRTADEAYSLYQGLAADEPNVAEWQVGMADARAKRGLAFSARGISLRRGLHLRNRSS